MRNKLRRSIPSILRLCQILSICSTIAFSATFLSITPLDPKNVKFQGIKVTFSYFSYPYRFGALFPCFFSSHFMMINKGSARPSSCPSKPHIDDHFFFWRPSIVHNPDHFMKKVRVVQLLHFEQILLFDFETAKQNLQWWHRWLQHFFWILAFAFKTRQVFLWDKSYVDWPPNLWRTLCCRSEPCLR